MRTGRITHKDGEAARFSMSELEIIEDARTRYHAEGMKATPSCFGGHSLRIIRRYLIMRRFPRCRSAGDFTEKAVTREYAHD